ncbi:MAG: nickel-dependent lactate racemase [Thermoplasmata archaeon]|nr:MAG: nickel-dependent lactate racemase [Thermoplasmata archaeon]
MQIQLPYGKGTLPLEVPDKNLQKVILPKEIIQPDRPEVIIRNALFNPMGTDRLSQIATEYDKVAILVDDYTRPCPTRTLLPPVLEELQRANVRDSNIIIIIANGTHKPPTDELKREIVGDKVFRNYRVISNDYVNGEFYTVGKSRFGNEIEVLREYVEADIKIILGDIEYHYFAGYGGTRKSILPGISSSRTVHNNHKMMFDKNAKAGVLKENPVHQEMNEAMHLAGCDFALNVVLNSRQRIVGAWAGNPDLVLDAGVKLVDEMYKIVVDQKADIVVSAASGHPHDLDLYQAYKALHTVLPVTNENGVIILVAECKKGHGNEIYYEWMKKYKTAKEVEDKLKQSFVMGAHKAYYHLKAIENHEIIFVSSMDKTEVEETFRFKHAKDLDDALKKAFDIAGKDATIFTVPQGTTTLLKLRLNK